MSQSKITVVVLLALLGVTVLVYLPGLAGSFIFDDFHNLDALGHYGGATSWEGAKVFIFSGAAGPMGRPLALATFLLNDQHWPSQAMPFKYTNLMIHLLVGLGVCWATLNLLRVLRYTEIEATWIALLCTGFWLLHPFFVSTTLYVIQRMAQLAALFSIYGIAAYLHGRKLIRERPAAGYAWMLGGLTFGGVLAVLSKENGVLLPVMLLAIEACLPQDNPVPRYFRLWKMVFLWFPTLLIVGYLARQIDFSDGLWPERPFNQVERLLTEPVIIVEYLYDLLIPKFEGRGLFQDGFEISRGILQPPRTLVSIVALLLLATLAFIGRRKYPLLALPVLFFFAGHLLESTLLGLELYFEHRSYLPAAFLFLPLAAGIVWMSKRFSVRLAVAVALVLIGFMSFMTWQRAMLWSSGYHLISYWALKSPESARAQNSLAQIMIESGRADEALDLLQRAVARLPESANLTTSLLMLKVADGSAEEKDFAWAGERLAEQPFDAQAVKGIYGLVDFVTSRDVRESYVAFTQSLLLRMAENERYMRFPLFQRFLPYQQGRLLLHQGDPQAAYEKFHVAMRLYGNIDSAMEMVVQTAGYGFRDQSLKLLDEAENLLASQENKSLIRSREAYQNDIAMIRRQLQEIGTNERAR